MHRKSTFPLECNLLCNNCISKTLNEIPSQKKTKNEGLNCTESKINWTFFSSLAFFLQRGITRRSWPSCGKGFPAVFDVWFCWTQQPNSSGSRWFKRSKRKQTEKKSPIEGCWLIGFGADLRLLARDDKGVPYFWSFHFRALNPMPMGPFNRRHLHIKLNLASFGTDELVGFGDAGQGWENLFFILHETLVSTLNYD